MKREKNKKKNKKKFVYMRVTADEYELPVALADTVRELAVICEVPRHTISSGICHRHGTFRKVEITEDEE